jgi:alkylated DNA repair dioxygenase AlkB
MSFDRSSNLIAEDGELYYQPAFLDAQTASSLFRDLRKNLDWQEETITIAGRQIKVPRLVCWYGDEHARYRYSGLMHEPKPWTKSLLWLKQRIEAICRSPFNSVLGNLYRDGSDSMGWHADKEKALGRNPVIASLSLGATRLFRLRHPASGKVLELDLQDGSLLIMAGSLQHHWRHCLPKSRTARGARINLTFRRIAGEEKE